MNGTSGIAFQQVGAGPDLVFLHGLLGRGGQWQAVAERLASRHRCWILELPGISASAPIADCSLPGLSRWLERALAVLGIGEFELVGASWGGAVALQFAARSGQRARLRRLVLAAPVHPFWRPNRRQRRLLTPPWTQLAAIVGAHLPLGVCRALMAPSFGDPARLPRASVRAYQELLRQPYLGAAVAAYARNWRADQKRLGAELAGIAAPVHLIWGASDRVVPAATAPALGRALARAHLVMLPGVGHLPYEETPEAFCRALPSTP